MKYIRTRYGIFDLSRFKFQKGDIDQSKVGSRQDCYWEQHNIEYCSHKCIWVKDIIAQADTIEELIEGIVAIRKSDNFKLLYTNTYIEEAIKYYKGKLKDFNVFGAIWTDKGLIYVAKINNKGELELL